MAAAKALPAFRACPPTSAPASPPSSAQCPRSLSASSPRLGTRCGAAWEGGGQEPRGAAKLPHCPDPGWGDGAGHRHPPSTATTSKLLLAAQIKKAGGTQERLFETAFKAKLAALRAGWPWDKARGSAAAAAKGGHKGWWHSPGGCVHVSRRQQPPASSERPACNPAAAFSPLV